MARARPWLVANRRDMLRALAPIFSLGLAWWLSAISLPPTIVLGTVAYGLAHLALVVMRRRISSAADPLIRKGTISWLAVGVDALFSLILINAAAALGDAIYPLYLLLIVRALSSYRRLPLAMIVPFLFGPAYLFVHRFGEPVLLSAPAAQAPDWALLLGSLVIGAIAIWASATQQRMTVALRQDLRAEQLGREARIGDLERSTNDLRARMRQLHALEEGLRVITSTLSLAEVLNQIVDSTVQMLGSARAHGMTLSLQDDQGFNHRFFMLDDSKGAAWATLLARRAMQQQVPLIIGDAEQDAAR